MVFVFIDSFNLAVLETADEFKERVCAYRKLDFNYLDSIVFLARKEKPLFTADIDTRGYGRGPFILLLGGKNPNAIEFE